MDPSIARRGGGGEPSHSQIVDEWRREDSDIAGARLNSLAEQGRRAAASPAVPGLVGRVLAKYDTADDSNAGREARARDVAVKDDRRDKYRREQEEQLLFERRLAVQFNWTARLISSSPHYSEVRERLETLGRLKNRELRLDTSTRELWLYLRDQLRTVNLTSKDTRTQLLHSIKEQLDLLSLHSSEIRGAVDALVREGWRDKLSEELNHLMQRRLEHLQNPEDCDEAKKLLCRISKPCGFGCQMHHVAYCFIFAYATERMLVLDSSGWRYSGNWDTVFQPLTTSQCNTGIVMHYNDGVNVRCVLLE